MGFGTVNEFELLPVFICGEDLGVMTGERSKPGTADGRGPGVSGGLDSSTNVAYMNEVLSR